jgi:hypothetical protein
MGCIVPDRSHGGRRLFCATEIPLALRRMDIDHPRPNPQNSATVHHPACTMQQVNINSSGGSYALSCSGQAFQMKGNFKLTFDGMTHMTTSGSIDSTANGKTTHMDSTTDFHWKGPTCNPNVDMNLRDFHKPPQ